MRNRTQAMPLGMNTLVVHKGWATRLCRLYNCALNNLARGVRTAVTGAGIVRAHVQKGVVLSKAVVICCRRCHSLPCLRGLSLPVIQPAPDLQHNLGQSAKEKHTRPLRLQVLCT